MIAWIGATVVMRLCLYGMPARRVITPVSSSREAERPVVIESQEGWIVSLLAGLAMTTFLLCHFTRKVV